MTAREIRKLIEGAYIYGEGCGGLGDVLLRLYFTGESWYAPLVSMPRGNYAVFVLMCHNPYAEEIWKWHPAKSRIHVIDLGFTTPFHPWESQGWRVEHGLPESILCPPFTPSKTLQFYPSPADLKFLKKLKDGGKYIVLAATAGQPDKSIPNEPRAEIIKQIVELGFQCLVVGRSMYLYREGSSMESIGTIPGVVNAVDQLSVPGMIEAVKGAAGVVSSDTSVLHAAWHEHRPVFLLYNQWTLENMIPRGAVGYMQGIDRSDTDHMVFSAYNNFRFLSWLKCRGNNEH